MSTDSNATDEFTIPLCISDLLTICKEYSVLGWNVQAQVEYILESGVEQAMLDKEVSLDSLPKIKSFLKTICLNPYFGEATFEACECIEMISAYEDKHPQLFNLKAN